MRDGALAAAAAIGMGCRIRRMDLYDLSSVARSAQNRGRALPEPRTMNRALLNELIRIQSFELFADKQAILTDKLIIKIDFAAAVFRPLN
jgi:hypothetical protein